VLVLIKLNNWLKKVRVNKFSNLLKRINVVLIIIVLCFAIYLIASPILPKTGFIAYTKEWIKDEVFNLKRNKIVIESIGVNGEIYEGDEDLLNLGFWHRPSTSTPDQGGNTVIIAHRFLYTYGPNTFHNLDKVKIGEIVKISWEGKKYSYQIKEIKIVKSTEINIEENTLDSILTLYSCISIWDSSERLVVLATIIEN